MIRGGRLEAQVGRTKRNRDFFENIMDSVESARINDIANTDASVDVGADLTLVWMTIFNCLSL